MLCREDTTELNFSGHTGSKKGFGYVGNGRDIGLFLHPVIVVDAGSGKAGQVGHAGGILGLADAFLSSRPMADPRGRKVREAEQVPRPIEDKETRRWMDGQASVERVLGGAAMVTLVGDRESDLYPLFAAPRSPHRHLLVRASHDRCLAGDTKLVAKIAALPAFEGQLIDIPSKSGQPARQARTSVRFGPVDILRSRSAFDYKRLPASVRLHVVEVVETDPPEGAKPVCWRLLTTHVITTLDQALQLIGWYRARWTIEQLFRTMKTQGFNLEDSQIETPQVMGKLVIAVMIAALRTLQLVHARSGTTGQKLTDAIAAASEPFVEALTLKLEGKTEKQKNPHPKGSLARLAWVVGRLGGWDGYHGHGYKPAGPKTMAAGLVRFDAIREGWEMTKDV